MASQVLSGTNTNLSYVNNTGQNVRVVINYLDFIDNPPGSAQKLTAGNMSIGVSRSSTVGRNLAHTGSGNNISSSSGFSCPTEVMLAPGQVFSVNGTCTFNIVIIPEAG